MFVNIGYGNMINTEKIVAMVTYDSAPAKRLVANAREQGNVVDATQGRKTRGVVVLENGNVLLSALLPETIAARSQDPDKEREADG